MLQFLSKHRFSLLGLTLGAAAGFSYWYFVGCASGTCPITSSAPISTGYGSLMGWLFIQTFKKS